MIGDPQSIKAFKTSITPENVKFFEDSDRDRMVGLVMHKAIFAEEGSELDDVGNEVFAEDDVAYEGAVVIYQFTIQEKNISGLLRADFDTFL